MPLRNQNARFQTAGLKNKPIPLEKEALFSLRQRKDVVVKPADEDGAAVVRARDLYIQEAERQLSGLSLLSKARL